MKLAGTRVCWFTDNQNVIMLTDTMMQACVIHK